MYNILEECHFGVANKKCLEALFLPIFKLCMSQIIHYHLQFSSQSVSISQGYVLQHCNYTADNVITLTLFLPNVFLGTVAKWVFKKYSKFKESFPCLLFFISQLHTSSRGLICREKILSTFWTIIIATEAIQALYH